MRVRLDRIKKLNHAHENIARYCAEGLAREDILRLSRLREDKLDYLLQNPVFLRRVDEIKTQPDLPPSREADLKIRQSLTLPQLAAYERKKSIQELAHIRDSAKGETARVSAASALLSQTKDIAADDDELSILASAQNIQRILKAVDDITWYVDFVLKTPDKGTEKPPEKTEEEPEAPKETHVHHQSAPQTDHESPVGLEARTAADGQVPVRI